MLNSNKKQNLLIFMSWLIYVSSYISRYSYNANIVAIKDYYGVVNADTGLVGTCFFFAYGAGQIINGLLCKKYNKKLFISIPLFISAFVNLIAFTLPNFGLFKYLWLLNGCSVSILWCLLVLMLSQILDDKHLSTSVIVMSSTVAVGTIITYGFSSLMNLFSGFKYSFLLGFIVPCLTGLIWLFICDKLTTKDVVNKTNNNVIIEERSKSKVSSGVIVLFILLGVFICVTNLVKDGLTTWVPQILKDKYGFSDSLSIVLTLVLPILGLFGATTVVVIDKLLKKEMYVCGLLFAILVVCVLGVILFFKTYFAIAVIILFGIISLITYGLNSYITAVFPLKVRDVINSGFSAGILNGCAYVGSVISAYFLGLIADNGSWDNVFYLLLTLCVVMLIISIGMAIYQKIKKNDNLF